MLIQAGGTEVAREEEEGGGDGGGRKEKESQARLSLFGPSHVSRFFTPTSFSHLVQVVVPSPLLRPSLPTS